MFTECASLAKALAVQICSMGYVAVCRNFTAMQFHRREYSRCARISDACLSQRIPVMAQGFGGVCAASDSCNIKAHDIHKECQSSGATKSTSFNNKIVTSTGSCKVYSFLHDYQSSHQLRSILAWKSHTQDHLIL